MLDIKELWDCLVLTIQHLCSLQVLKRLFVFSFSACPFGSSQSQILCPRRNFSKKAPSFFSSLQAPRRISWTNRKWRYQSASRSPKKGGRIGRERKKENRRQKRTCSRSSLFSLTFNKWWRKGSCGSVVFWGSLFFFSLPIASSSPFLSKSFCVIKCWMNICSKSFSEHIFACSAKRWSQRAFHYSSCSSCGDL